MINIVAVDDSKEYLNSLQQIFQPLKKSYNLVFCFNHFENDDNIDFLIKKLGNLNPDVILMDLSFTLAGRPHDFGIELVRLIISKYPNQKIIMLVGDDEMQDEVLWENIQSAFSAGAVAYLGKKHIYQLRAAIVDVVNGENFVNEESVKSILNVLGKKINPNATLTRRQREVLIHLADDKTIKQIAESIKGADDKPLAIHTINFHLRNIRARLNSKTLHGLVAKSIRGKIIK